MPGLKYFSYKRKRSNGYKPYMSSAHHFQPYFHVSDEWKRRSIVPPDHPLAPASVLSRNMHGNRWLDQKPRPGPGIAKFHPGAKLLVNAAMRRFTRRYTGRKAYTRLRQIRKHPGTDIISRLPPDLANHVGSFLRGY